MRRLLSWIDDRGLLVWAVALVAFIPLFPKIPLADVIPGYLVRIRLEDILVLLAGLWWLVQAGRGRLRWLNLVVLGFSLFIVVSGLSLLSAVFLLGWVPLEPLHLFKSALMLVRHLEYFSLFVIMFSAVRSKRDVKVVLVVLALTIVAATVYGFGQKQLGWPLYSTMNREFSKGVALQLSEHARVQSTFAGPYDLSAFLVITLPLLTGLPLLLGLALRLKNKVIQLGLLLVHLAGLWLMAVGASKSAVVAYGLAMVVVTLLSASRLRRRWVNWAVAAVVVVVVLTTLSAMVVAFGGDASGRLVSIVAHQPHVQRLLPASLLARVPTTSDRPEDVYVEMPDIVEVTTVTDTGQPVTRLVERQRVYSQNALKYGLSAGIRLDELWPRAVSGLVRNPFLGSGFGTLNKDGPVHFTEADSTDNQYLRTLGETGLLGFATFFGTVLLTVRYAWLAHRSRDPLVAGLSIGFIGATVGLLANALYIDVLVASKVAFTFWAMAGLVVKTYFLEHPQSARRDTRRWWSLVGRWLDRHWPLVAAVLIWMVATHAVPFSQRGVITNLGAAPHQTEHLTSARCWLERGSWQRCRSTVSIGQVGLSEGDTAGLGLPAPSPIYTSWLLPFLVAFQFPQGYYYANLVLSAFSLLLMYALAVRLLNQRWQRMTALLVWLAGLSWIALPLVPSAENLRLVLVMTAGYLAVKFGPRPADNTRRWILWTVLILAVITRFGVGPTSVVLLLPWLSLLAAAVAQPVLMSARVLAGRRLAAAGRLPWSWLAVAATGVGAAVMITLVPGPQLWRAIKLKFQPERNFWQKSVLDQLVGDISAASQDRPATLITTLDPFFVDFYLSEPIQLLPLATDQFHFQQAQLVWGPENYSDLPELYRRQLAQGRALFVTDFNDNRFQRPAEFGPLTRQFSLQLLEIGCDERCSLYRLSLPQPYQPSPPETITTAQLDPAKFGEELSFIVYSHRFTPPLAGERNNTLLFTKKLAELSELGPDLVMLMGDALHIADGSQQKLFFEQIEPTVSYPIVYTPGNYDSVATKLFGPEFQSFRIGPSVFITLNGGPNGELGAAQTQFAVNQVLELSADDTVVNVFVFTHRLSWLGRDQLLEPLTAITNQRQLTSGDGFVQRQLFSRLEELTGKSVYVFSGDISPGKQPSLVYHRPQDSAVTYLASAVNSRPSDVFLQVSVRGDQVTVLPISSDSQQLGNLEQYSDKFWQSKLGPDQVQPGTPDKVATGLLSSLLPAMGVAAGWSIGWWLLKSGWLGRTTAALKKGLLAGV